MTVKSNKQKGFSYLKDKDGNKQNWREVTRDERFFCAHLYERIRGNERDFIKWLNKHSIQDGKPPLKLDARWEWEIGYEVCFYRDYDKNIRTIKGTCAYYSPKRTFDLCLFSEKTIVIIEAKVHGGFEAEQVKDIIKDLNEMPTILGNDTKVYAIALASSQYFDNHNQPGRRISLDCFSSKVNWLDMYCLYEDPIFIRAECVYKN